MAVVPTHPARTFATAAAPGAGSIRHASLERPPGQPSGPYGCRANEGGQWPVCPQEGLEQAVKGVRGFDDGGNEATLLAHGRDIAYRTDLVEKRDE